MKSWTGINVRKTTAVAALLVAGGCAAAGDAGKTPDGGAAGASAGASAQAGTGGGAGASAGADGSGGAAAGGSSGAAGDGGGGTAGPTGVACEPKAAFTLAIHVVLNVSWDGSLGAGQGSGQYHLWNLAKITANGTALTGTLQLCGNTLPELPLSALVGGGKVQLEIPNAVWDLPSAPKFPTAGTLAGWTTGSALTTTPTIALVGLTMPDPAGAWPTSYTSVTSVDIDADGNPGITAIPKTGTGYVQTPVATPIFGAGPKADKLYLASRTGVALNGKLTTCTEQAGTATITFFDSHVVGCHVSGGDVCTPAQVDFVDTNRTAYSMMTGTFTSKMVADTATCADARAP